LDAASFTPSATETYQQWAAQHLPEEAALPDDDADGDGLTNVIEFAFNTPPMDPANASAQANLPDLQMLPGSNGLPTPTLLFTGVYGVLYSVEAATSPDGWWTTIDTFSARNPGPQFWQWDDAEFHPDVLFLRIRITVLPWPAGCRRPRWRDRRPARRMAFPAAQARLVPVSAARSTPSSGAGGSESSLSSPSFRRPSPAAHNPRLAST